jgi:hypothetical protein
MEAHFKGTPLDGDIEQCFEEAKTELGMCVKCSRSGKGLRKNNFTFLREP